MLISIILIIIVLKLGKLKDFLDLLWTQVLLEKALHIHPHRVSLDFLRCLLTLLVSCVGLSLVA